MNVETFYIILSFCLVVLTGFIVWLCIRLNNTLTNLDHILLEAKGVISDIEFFKDGLRSGLVALITGLVQKLRSDSKK